MTEFNIGPFLLSSAPRPVTVAGVASQRWTLSYGDAELSFRTIREGLTQQQVHDEFAGDIAEFARKNREANAPSRVDLIDFESGDDVAHFYSGDMCGMTPGLIDDRSRYWIRSEGRLYSRAVTLSEFAMLAVAHADAQHGWIAGLLTDAVLTNDPGEWRAPTSWEIRHVVGEGSFTGITGSKAAELVGVSAQNFRKYTARDGASTRQSMSFAMWHLLLHKLGVKRV